MNVLRLILISFTLSLSRNANGYVATLSSTSRRSGFINSLNLKPIPYVKAPCHLYAATLDHDVEINQPTKINQAKEKKNGKAKKKIDTPQNKSNKATTASKKGKKGHSIQSNDAKKGKKKKTQISEKVNSKKTSSTNSLSKPKSKVDVKNKQKRKPSKSVKQQKPLSEIKVGSIFNGCEVLSCRPYGAYVKIKGYATKGNRALLHISQIKNEKISDVSSVLSVGQKLNNVKVVKIDKATGMVRVSIRPPRVAVRSTLGDLAEKSIGEMHSGRITSIAKYGAFVDIGCKTTHALLHKSRIFSDQRVDDVSSVFKRGDMVEVRLIDVDLEKSTMAVSMLNEKSDIYLEDRKRKKSAKLAEALALSFVVDHRDEVEVDGYGGLFS